MPHDTCSYYSCIDLLFTLLHIFKLISYKLLELHVEVINYYYYVLIGLQLYFFWEPGTKRGSFWGYDLLSFWQFQVVAQETFWLHAFSNLSNGAIWDSNH